MASNGSTKKNCAPPDPFVALQTAVDCLVEDRSIMRQMLFAQRQMLLGQIDAIERALNISPRTAEIRRLDRR